MKKLFCFLILFGFFFVSCSFLKEDDEVKVSGLSFEYESIDISVGEQKSVSLFIKPEEIIPDVKVEYRLSDSENKCVSLSNESSSGLVITGVQNGSCVLIAQCQGFTGYLQINVSGSLEIIEPYIVTNNVVFELKEGDRKAITVSLYGGSPQDNSLFEFSSNDSDVVSVTQANNSCILEAKKSGFAKIEILHEKSKYPSYVMCYVTKDKETPCYITTSHNILPLSIDGGSNQISVNLVGSSVNDLSLFSYEIIEGNEVCDVINNNNIFSFTPKKCGSLLLEVRHPESKTVLELRVFVVKTSTMPYIKTLESVLVFDDFKGKSFKCEVTGEVSPDYMKKFSYSLRDEGIVDIKSCDDMFYVEPLKEGKTVVTVSNDYCGFDLEVYLIVNGYKETYGSYYITTGQNIIRGEVGDEIPLDLSLINGIESDRNNFSWMVQDSSVIKVQSSFGTVSYGRSVLNNTVDSVLPFNALLSLVGVGTSEIEVFNPKCDSSCKILVKVYPKGTLLKDKYGFEGSGLCKVLLGSEVEHTVRYSGNETSDFIWQVEDSKIAEVSGTGLSSLVRGLKKGSSVLSVSHNDIASRYEATLICGETPEELEEMPVIYTDNRFLELYSGSPSYIEIKHTGFLRDDGYTAVSSDPLLCDVHVRGDVLVVEPKKASNVEVRISHPDSINDLVLYLSVLDKVTIEKPLFFSYEKFVGIVLGCEKRIKVSLNGGTESERNKVQWSIEDNEICSFIGNGEECIVEALSVGETYLTAHSSLSEDDAKILCYVARTEEELMEKVILRCEKNNYITTVGKDIFVSVSVNNPEINRENITWECDDISVLKVDGNYDIAYLRPLSEGNCVVSVRCGTSVPEKIFVSVVKDLSDFSEKTVVVPGIVELLTGQNKVIRCDSFGLSSDEESSIIWESSDESLLQIKGSGRECYVKALKKGSCEIHVRQPSLGIEKKISVIIADTYEEIESLVVLGLSSSLYRIEKGNTCKVNLTFGSKKPSDEIVSSLSWTSSDSNIVALSSFGSSCILEGKEEGVCDVTVKGEGVFNEITFKVIVYEGEGVSYYIDCERIKGLLVGSDIVLPLSLKTSFGNEVLGSYSFYEVSVSDESVCEVKRSDDKLYIKALGEGETFITVSHLYAKENVNILIYAKQDEESLKSYYPLSSLKNYFLIDIGQTVYLDVVTVNDDKLSSLKWALSNSSCVVYENGATKKQLKVTGKKNGVCTFTVSHPESDNSVEFTVCVNSGFKNNKDVSIITDSIIGVGIGEEVFTFIHSNISEEEKESLLWEISDSEICEIEGFGERCRIKGLKEGVCELTVKYSSDIYRTLLVKVTESSDFRLMNVDKRLYKIPLSEEISVKPFYGSLLSDATSFHVSDVYENKVVDFSYRNGFLYVKACNEGMAVLSLSNSECENQVNLYFEVGKALEKPGVVDLNAGYLSSPKPLYVLDKDDRLSGTVISLNCFGFNEEQKDSIKWSVQDKNIVSIVGGADSVTCFSEKEGRTKITASSVFSANTVDIDVIVLSREQISYPYLYSVTKENEVYVGEEKKFSFDVKNVGRVLPQGFEYSVLNPEVVSIRKTGNSVYLTGLKEGQTLLNVSYGFNEVSSINMLVSVVNQLSGIVYLTTDDNYSVIPENSYKNLSVKLCNAEEINGENFSWTVLNEESENGNQVISLSGSGKEVLCRGINPGIALISVSHVKCEFPLKMTVRVSEKGLESPVYIKANENILNLVSGSKVTVSCDLVNGNESQYSQFSWVTSTPDILNINFANNSCVVQGLKPGIGRITVSHPSSVGQSIDILCVVEEDYEKSKLYISCDNTLVEMKPSDSYKQINVNLVGGTAEQNSLFSWEIISFESVVKTKDGVSSPVISLNGSGNSAIVKPLSEGVSVVRVRNGATNHYLDIKILVTLYSSLNFTSSSLTIKEGETQSVDVEAPTGKTIFYESSNENVCTVSGTNRICIVEGTGKGSCVVTAYSSDGTLRDEIIVKVNENKDFVNAYIKCSSNVVLLNTKNDASGRKIDCSLFGSDVVSGDEEEITWTIGSGKKDVFGFIGNSGTSVKGSEVYLKPFKGGNDCIVLTHPKCRNSKTIYVSVEEDYASLKLSESYFSVHVEDTGFITCTLDSSDVDVSKFTWRSNNTGIVVLPEGDDSGIVHGDSVYFKGVGLGNTTVSCTYDNTLTKNVSVYVTEEPSLRIPVSSVQVFNGDVQYIDAFLTPASSYSDVELNVNSTSYADISWEEKSLEHLRLKVKGKNANGVTTVTLKCGNLVAKCNVVTNNDLSLSFGDYVVYKGGNIIKNEKKPSVIIADNTCDKIRLHYSSFPENLPLKAPLEGRTVYTDSPKVNTNGKGFTLTFGSEGDEYPSSYKKYVDIVPEGSGQELIQFVGDTQNQFEKSIYLVVRNEDFSPVIGTQKNKGSGLTKVNDGIGTINIASKEDSEIEFRVVSGLGPLDSYSVDCDTSKLKTMSGLSVSVSGDGTKVIMRFKGISSSRTILQSVVNYGFITVTVSQYFGQDIVQTVKKSYLVSLDQY